ncbi:LysE family transporter [Halorubrum vacuolatum]|nr:LysE family transporter [Halorubrum vacuolatum]
MGTAFGLALAAPPGPMNAIIAEEAVLRGWHAGARAGLGAATADVLFFILAFVGVAALIESAPRLQTAMVGGGGLLMCYFAIGAARNARAMFRPTSGDEPTIEAGNGYYKALVLALSNPFQVLFWLTVGVGLLRPGRLDVLAPIPVLGDTLTGTLVVTTGSPAILGGFFAGIFGWVLAFPALLAVAERRVETFGPVVAVGSAVVLGGFGIVFLADALTTVLAWT